MVISQLLLIHNNNKKVCICVCMVNPIVEERKRKIQILSDKFTDFEDWSEYKKYAFAYLFRSGLTSEKIEEDYLAGLQIMHEAWWSEIPDAEGK